MCRGVGGGRGVRGGGGVRISRASGDWGNGRPKVKQVVLWVEGVGGGGGSGGYG